MADLLIHERRCYEEGFRYVMGVDEVGRGPLAGPVVAAAVILRETTFENLIDDSKKLTSSQRERAFLEIFDKAYVGIGMMCETVVDACNILEATFLAMEAAARQAVFRLSQQAIFPEAENSSLCLLIDGNRFKSSLPYAYRTIVGGDGKSLSIACASIVAKVIRDRILDQYHQILPQYGFDRHKGYPTVQHLKALEEYGAAFVHRKTFGPVRQVCRS